MIKGCVFYACVGVYLFMYVYYLLLVYLYLFCYSFYYLSILLLLYRDVFMRAILLTMEFTMSKSKSKSKTGLYAMRAIAVSVIFGLCALVPFSMYVSKNYNEDGIRITTPVVSMSSTNVETYSSGDAVLDAKVAELNSLLGY